MRADLESVCYAYRFKPPGVQLRRMREAVGCSQRQLAESCGLPQSTISRLESGADAPISTWIRVMEALGGSVYLKLNDEDTIADQEADAAVRKEKQRAGLREGGGY